MAYVRKTTDEWEIQCKYPNGDLPTYWETVTVEESFKEARRAKRDYLNNDRYLLDIRIVKRRVKKESDNGNTNS